MSAYFPETTIFYYRERLPVGSDTVPGGVCNWLRRRFLVSLVLASLDGDCRDKLQCKVSN